MDQIKDSLADQHHRRRRKHTKIRCFLGCFGGGGTSEEDGKLPQKFKSINQSRSWFSCLKFGRKKKDPKRTVPDPVESQSDATDEKINQGRFVLGRSKSKSKYNEMIISDYDEIPDENVLGQSKSRSNKMVELPVKGDDEEMLKQPPVAGDVLREKANKIRKRSIFLRYSKSMNHIQQQQLEDPIIVKEKPTKSSLRKSKSAKATTLTTLVNQPPVAIRPSTTDLSLSLSLSQSQAHEQQQEITSGGGRENQVDDDENRVVQVVTTTEEEKKKRGSMDRVVGISIIVMVLVIMAVWGKLCAILCSSAWLYFYPLLLRAHNHNNNKNRTPRRINVAPTTESNKSQWQKKKVVFEGFLQRDR